jgi:hypothetical protein
MKHKLHIMVTASIRYRPYFIGMPCPIHSSMTLFPSQSILKNFPECKIKLGYNGYMQLL